MEFTSTSFIGLVNLLLIVMVAIVNHMNHIKLTTNDLVHLTSDVKTIISRQEGISEKVSKLAEDLAYVKGNCSLNACKRTVRKVKKI